MQKIVPIFQYWNTDAAYIKDALTTDLLTVTTKMSAETLTNGS